MPDPSADATCQRFLPIPRARKSYLEHAKAKGAQSSLFWIRLGERGMQRIMSKWGNQAFAFAGQSATPSSTVQSLTTQVAEGVTLGRKPKLTAHQRRKAIARRESGEVLTDIARSYNVSHSTISRLN